MALRTVYSGEDLHMMGADGCKLVRQWLDSTLRFRMLFGVYELHPSTHLPMSHSRLNLENGGSEHFDLIGQILDDRGAAGNLLYVECKNYTGAQNQKKLYLEYLVACYSAFTQQWKTLDIRPSIEFMWATTHPFWLDGYQRLATADLIETACSDSVLASAYLTSPFDRDIADVLAERLWISIVNPRTHEMMMGSHFYQQFIGQVLRPTP